ncbi:alpha/beta fold hydrolase [Silicimonas algicola]|nr:alpha/beta hydrolase [Silicimonas algicola]
MRACLDYRGDILAPAQYGIGGVPRHPAPPTLGDHVDLLMTQIGAEGPVVLAGCAVGSLIAAEAAARLGPRALGLVMANPMLQVDAAASAALTGRAERALEGGIAAIEDEVISRGFAGLDLPEAVASFRDGLHAMGADVYADLAHGICGADVTGAIRALKCPLLLAPGGQDAVLPDWHLSKLRAMSRDARVEVIEPGGHFMPQQAPEAFAAALVPFLRQVAARR